jgi:RNA recognition motif-containing protein
MLTRFWTRRVPIARSIPVRFINSAGHLHPPATPNLRNPTDIKRDWDKLKQVLEIKINPEDIQNVIQSRSKPSKYVLISNLPESTTRSDILRLAKKSNIQESDCLAISFHRDPHQLAMLGQACITFKDTETACIFCVGLQGSFLGGRKLIVNFVSIHDSLPIISFTYPFFIRWIVYLLKNMQRKEVLQVIVFY